MPRRDFCGADISGARVILESGLQAKLVNGLPETLEEWIPYNGVTAIKIKLNGADLAWDVDRVAAIDRVTTAAQAIAPTITAISTSLIPCWVRLSSRMMWGRNRLTT
jgi:hypothetical protein